MGLPHGELTLQMPFSKSNQVPDGGASQTQGQNPGLNAGPSPSQTQSQGALAWGAAPPGANAAVHALSSRALPAEAGVWDELRSSGDQLRPAWDQFARHLPPAAGGVGVGEDLARRLAQVHQRIRLDGVTHNVFSDASVGVGSKAGSTAASTAGTVAARAWSLELLPLLIDAADWAHIEAGVAQRAALLERVLADLYGPQRLLHEGLLPPALLLRHPGWLRPLMGSRPTAGQHLYIVAFDIARGPDGRWWLVAQRTQGPSGLGYVLHNRLVIARQFPDAFRELRVQRIASSYRQLLDTLENHAAQVAAASGRSTPRVVLLTPGPYSETYFEHAYLARYLGLPLVEGGDLTVRDQRLYMKTVAGLEPVHGVMRRLDDDWCDPLELRPDSALGVPGLLQAARAGTVVMANALGSGFLESPAIAGFLPAIAQRLLGQRLSLPALPTWWCGEAAAWQDVRGHLPDKVLRSTFPRGGRTSQVHELNDAAVHDDPDAWTVQGRLRFSRAPIWSGGAVSPRPAMVRVYAVADGQGGWHVLPGGMTRVSQREDASLSMQRGGTSLDTWVLTDGEVSHFSMLPQRLRVEDIEQRGRPVSSRTGENLFWLGRYTERSEQLVRLARATLLLIDTDRDAAAPVRQALSALAVRSGLAPMGVPTLVQSTPLFERSVLAGLADLSGCHGSFSIAYNLAALERAGQALRDRLSPEQWRLLRSLGEQFGRMLECPPGDLPQVAQVLPALDQLGQQLAAVTGAQSDRMLRDHGWRLLTVGRLIERLQGLTASLECFVQAQALGGVTGVDLLLELFDSVISFRARYQRHEDVLALIDMLVLDSSNPRAFAGVLRRLRTEIGKLPGSADSLQPLLQMLPAQGAGLTLQSLRGADDAALLQLLQTLTADLGASANALAERVGERFFTLAHGLDQRV